MASPIISELRVLERREFRLRLVDRFEQMLETVLSGSLAEPRIFDRELEALSTRKLLPLDIDEDQPLDLEPYHCQKFDRKRWCGDTSCADFRMNWFIEAVGRYRRGLMPKTAWALGRQCMDSDCPYYHESLGDGKFVTWNDHHVEDNLKPHVMMAVKYPYPIPGGLGPMLRAEVASAIHCILYQLRHGLFVHHRILPVLLRTYYHDRGARITQAHWDGNYLIIRQSRVLDFHAPEPTDDAYLLIEPHAMALVIKQFVDEKYATAAPQLLEKGAWEDFDHYRRLVGNSDPDIRIQGQFASAKVDQNHVLTDAYGGNGFTNRREELAVGDTHEETPSRRAIVNKAMAGFSSILTRPFTKEFTRAPDSPSKAQIEPEPSYDLIRTGLARWTIEKNIFHIKERRRNNDSQQTLADTSVQSANKPNRTEKGLAGI
ncbi:predicted protein [Chaetomium globosum CBS 148.51]|uniref:Uncharacterized protein n=1 Tax=Chaetomium globosum (strain ATCC 6205 / CBS 148.51 / DSM 1962 / NBRC 6347 / NRRL 1970) TaxID=306901 RepID=Q2GWJ1_CHAGB|nr:uncharacterized protein CHGG_07663 [Chaetomium globosum CBS 148.51]EAQ86410.1 predicted protein [Chaetomium globosum CBS 148.51]